MTTPTIGILAGMGPRSTAPVELLDANRALAVETVRAWLKLRG